MEVNFPTSRVTALITELQDEQGNPWQYQLRDAESIYFPGVNLDGQAHFKARPGYQASVTHVGFAAQPFSAGDTQFEGWLLGEGRDEEAGTGAFGTWSLGNRQNAGSSYLVGAFGAERTSVREADRPSVGATGSESWITQGTEMDDLFFKQGGTVFRPTKGDDHPDNDDTVYEIDLATLEKNGAGGKTVINGVRQVGSLREEVQAQLAKLEGYIAVDEADGASVTQREGREAVWTEIRTRILKVVFASGTDDIFASSNGRPNYDAELGLRPFESVDPVDNSSPADGDTLDAADGLYFVDGSATYDATNTNTAGYTFIDDDNNEAVTLNERVKLMVLSTDNYPGLTSATAGTPNDDAARQEIDAVLDALTNGTTLAAALGDGGLWEGLLAETRSAYRDENYDGYADVKNGKRLIERREGRRGLGRAELQYPRAAGHDRLHAVRRDMGRAGFDTTSFAYSPLPQVRYASAASPGYPGGASATYRGSTIFRGSRQHALRGQRWRWMSAGTPDTLGDSRVTVTFSELAKIADSEPFSIGYILVDSSGNRLLKNGRIHCYLRRYHRNHRLPRIREGARRG